MNFDERGSNGRVELICQYTVYRLAGATAYVINVLILGQWTEETKVKVAWMGKEAIFI